MSRIRHALVATILLGAAALIAPLYAAVHPPKLDYQITTLPNGLRVILSEDHSTPIVHVSRLVSRRLEGREAWAHRVRAPLRAHDVQGLEERASPKSHTSIIASIGGRSNAYTQEDATVFWETLPAQYLPLALLARGRSDGDAARRSRRVRERARGRQGRAPAARRQSALRPAERDPLRPRVHDASVQAPDDRQHEGSRGGVARGRPRFPRHVLRSGKRGGDDRRRLRFGAGHAAGARSNSAACRRPTRPVPRDIPKEPEQTQERRATIQEEWPLPGRRHRVSRRLRRASRFVSAAPDVEDSVRRRERADDARARLRQADRASRPSAARNILQDPNLFYAVAIVPAGQSPRPSSARCSRSSTTLKTDGGHGARAASARRTSSCATTSSAARPTSRRRSTWRTRR